MNIQGAEPWCTESVRHRSVRSDTGHPWTDGGHPWTVGWIPPCTSLQGSHLVTFATVLIPIYYTVPLLFDNKLNRF